MKHKVYDPPTIELFVLLKQDLIRMSLEKNDKNQDPTFDDGYKF